MERKATGTVGDGLTDLDELLEDRLAALKIDRDRAKAALDRIHVAERPAAAIDPDLVERFRTLMRGTVTTGGIPLRRLG